MKLSVTMARPRERDVTVPATCDSKARIYNGKDNRHEPRSATRKAMLNLSGILKVSVTVKLFIAIARPREHDVTIPATCDSYGCARLRIWWTGQYADLK